MFFDNNKSLLILKRKSMKIRLPNKSSVLATMILAGFGTGIPSTHAQEAASEGEVFELSPFVIEASDDEGWVAGTTLVGTRTRTSLYDLPLSVDAITADFMDDLSITDLAEAAEWIPGLDSTNLLDQQNDEDQVSFRGLETGGRENAQSSRNFFLWYPRTDSYNIERIDFNKGSNSLMFGDASPGGVATTYTKRAYTSKNFGEISARYGSYDTYRLTLDYNYAVSDKVALRFNWVENSKKEFVNFFDDTVSGGHLAGTYKPFKNTILRFEYEKLDWYRTQGSNRIRVNQRAGDYGGFGPGSSSRQILTSDGSYYDPRTETFYETDGAGGFLDGYFLDRRNGPTGDDLSLADGQIAEIRNYRSPYAVFMTLGPIDPKTNVRGNFAYLSRDVEDYTVWLEQKLGDLVLELAYNRQNQEQIRDDSGFSDVLNVDYDGRVWNSSDFALKWYGNETNIVRFTAAYPLETKWFSQYIVANASYQDDLATSWRRHIVNKAKAYDEDTGEYDVTTDLDANHRIRFFNYIDLDNPGDFGYQSADWTTWPVVPGLFEPMWVDYTTGNKPFTDKRYTRTASLSMFGEYFKGKLKSLVGVRRDHFKLKGYVLPTGSRSELVAEYGELAWWGQDVYLGSPDEAPEQYAYLPDMDQKDTTYTAGLVYTLTDTMNVYGTWSTSFRWQGTEDFLGRPLGPQTGETVEFGIKANLFDKKLFLNIAGYEVVRDNVAFQLGSGNNADELELLFNEVDIVIEPDGTMVYIPAEPGDPGFVEIGRGLNQEHRQITANETSRGFEMTATLQRWNGLQVRLTAAHVEIESARDTAEYATYVAAAAGRESERAAIIAQYWPNDPNYSPNGLPDIEEDLREYLEYAQEQVEANSGLGRIEGSRARPWRFSWILDYEFPESFILPELRVLLMGSYKDSYLIDINDGIDWIGGAEHILRLGFIYDTEVFDYDTRFQLYINNLTDLENNKVRPSGGFVDQYTDQPHWQYANVIPASIEFRVSVEF